jgi:hypothetical protein
MDQTAPQRNYWKPVQDFNELFGMAENIKDSEGFYNYYNARKSKHPKHETDILLVANISFLTGYDSKKSKLHCMLTRTFNTMDLFKL